MVNNNQIPIEVNKKPFETVCEINDDYEVPSFEEFMKGYESDGNLNYDDLKGSSVGEVEGHGPCEVCKKPEQETILEVSCPVPLCSDKTPGRWYHNRNGCRSSCMKISNRGNLRCSNCSTSGKVGYWLFICSNHGGTPESATPSAFRKALSVVLASDDCDEVINDLGEYMTDPKHKKEWFY